MSAILPPIIPPADDDLTPIVKAVKQLLAVKPQLLFDACKQAYSDIFLDAIKAGFEGKGKTEQALKIRCLIAQSIAQVLLHHTDATLSDNDIAAMVHVMTMGADKRNGGKDG